MNHLRLLDFTFEEFRILKEILIDWDYEWLEYNLIHDSDKETVDVTFHIDESLISLSEFIHLIYTAGKESVFRQ